MIANRFCLRAILVALTTSTVMLASAVSADTVVVPNINTNSEGDDANAIPFNNNLGLFCDPGIRYQQVYDDVDLPNGYIISAARFRQDVESGEPFSNEFYAGVSVTLSTTAVNTATMSTTFADNVGPDATVVFSGDLELSTAVSAEMPRPFDIEIPFQNFFAYPGGNLLMDIVITDCPSPFGFLDAQTAATTQRLYSSDIASETGGGLSPQPYGLVTQFELAENVELVPVPTSSFWSLLALVALLSALGLRTIRRQRQA